MIINNESILVFLLRGLNSISINSDALIKGIDNIVEAEKKQ